MNVEIKFEVPDNIRDKFQSLNICGQREVITCIFNLLEELPNECVEYSTFNIKINIECVKNYFMKLVEEGMFRNYLRLKDILDIIYKNIQFVKRSIVLSMFFNMKERDVLEFEKVSILPYTAFSETEVELVIIPKNTKHYFENMISEDLIALSFDRAYFETEGELEADVIMYITYEIKYHHFVTLLIPIGYESLWSKEKSYEELEGYIATAHVSKFFNLNINDLIMFFDKEVWELESKEEKVKKIVEYLNNKGFELRYFKSTIGHK